MDTIQRLRTILAANAAVTAATGAVALAAAGPLSDALEMQPNALRILGASFLLLAADVALLARARPSRLAPGARLLAGLDLAWALGMLAIVALGVLELAGAAVALATGVVTAGFGWAEGSRAAQVRHDITGREAFAA